MNKQKRLEVYIEDFRFKMNFLPPIGQWQALKQIECFCVTNQVKVPIGIKLLLLQHEKAAQRDGAFLDGWDGCELVTSVKNQGVKNGNCMFYFKKIKLKGQQ